MILEQGTKVLIVHRRLFEDDHPRFFVGEVEGYESGVAKVEGYTWLKDPFTGTFVRKEDRRTKIVSLTSGTLIVYELGDNVDLKSTRIDADRSGRVVLTDGKKLKMDLNETVQIALPRSPKKG